MTQASRRHHVNPKFLLAGFTDKGHKNGKIWQFDQQNRIPTRSRPKAVGWEWDYYAVQVPGQPIDIAETSFGKIETSASPIIKNIVASESLPTGDDYQILMSFLALMYGRGPTRRFDLIDTLERHQTEVVKMAMRMPGAAERFLASLKRKGLIPEDATLDALTLDALDDEFRLTISNQGEVHTAGVMATLVSIARLLAERNWAILKVEDPESFFITTDSCCAILWDDPAMYNQFGPPAPAWAKTELIFPIHRTTALVGKFDDVETNGTLDRFQVAVTNFNVSAFATRYVYGPESDFEFAGPDGVVRGWPYWYRNRPTVFGNPYRDG